MKAVLARALEFVKRRYFTVDARSLALFRVLFGLHLIANLYDRTSGPDAIAFYTNLGVLPNHYALYAPLGDHLWSLLFPFSKPAEVQVAFAVILLVYIAYVIGYRTKWAQIGAVVCLLSLTNRNLMLQNGGIVVTNLVALWTSLLPLGARFSIDHLRRSLRERDEVSVDELAARSDMARTPVSYVRIAFFGILLNFACIYFFNYAHKRGTTWHDGSAVHWVLWQNRINTIWAAFLRMHEPAWLSPVLTRGTLIIEAAIPVLLLSPFATKWTRRGAIACIWALHSGISLMMTLGPFSYSMMAFSLLLVGREDWELVRRAFAWRGPRVEVLCDPSSRAEWEMCRLLARLDLRGALSFSEGRALPEIDQRTATRVLSALPLGFSYAWVARLPGASWMGRKLASMIAIIAPVARGSRRSGNQAAQTIDTAKRLVADLFAVVLLVTAATQILSDNWAIADRYRIKQRPSSCASWSTICAFRKGGACFLPTRRATTGPW